MSIAHGEKYVFKGGEGGPIMVYGGISAVAVRARSLVSIQKWAERMERDITFTASRLKREVLDVLVYKSKTSNKLELC